MRSRTIAIGDVHGCSRALASLLEAIQPRPLDVIVTLGDYVNRGPDSRGVLERLIALEAQCTLIPLLGNHDQALLEALAGESAAGSNWLEMGGVATLNSYGAEQPTLADLARIPAAHREFIERCREFHESDTHIFVHAQYDADMAMDEQSSYYLRWESLRHVTPGPHVSGKKVILGHTSQKSGEILDLGYLVCIDTHCYGGGWLTALDVHTAEVWQTDRQGELRSAQAR